jgi:hypothetical protein
MSLLAPREGRAFFRADEQPLEGGSSVAGLSALAWLRLRHHLAAAVAGHGCPEGHLTAEAML